MPNLQGESSSAAEDERGYVWPTAPSWLKGPNSPYRGAVLGGSGSACFGLGDAGAGKAGTAAFVGSPWQGPTVAPPVRLGVAAAGVAAGASPAPAAGAAAAAAAGQGGFWNLASLQQRLQTLGLAGVMAYGEERRGVRPALLSCRLEPALASLQPPRGPHTGFWLSWRLLGILQACSSCVCTLPSRPVRLF